MPTFLCFVIAFMFVFLWMMVSQICKNKKATYSWLVTIRSNCCFFAGPLSAMVTSEPRQASPQLILTTKNYSRFFSIFKHYKNNNIVYTDEKTKVVAVLLSIHSK